MAVFITFEGGEGVGKSTQARLLAKALQDQHLTVISTREVGGTPLGEAIRELFLDEKYEMNRETEIALIEAARSDHLSKVIIPALCEGEVVICDRYFDSTIVYQNLTDSEIEALHPEVVPILTILLDGGDPEAMLNRVPQSARNKFEAKSIEFHREIRNRYDALAKRHPDRIKVIPIENSGVHDVHCQVMALVRQHVDSLGGSFHPWTQP